MSELRTNRIVPRDGMTSGSTQGGGVIQVRYGFTTAQTVNNTSTYADTGLSATITPTRSDSKIIVMASLNCVQKNNNTYTKVRVVRDSTEIAKIDEGAGYTNDSSDNIIGSISCHLLDSPATTSAVTYKLQFASVSNISTTLVQVNNALSSMILMEVTG
tara:strand:- start:26 stop:502 length:477 start_codon:yes stop_codon:yes gene_type:complete